MSISEITEADVKSWMLAKHFELGVPVFVSAASDYGIRQNETAVRWHVGNYPVSGSGATIAEARAEVAIRTNKRSAEARAEAAKLIAEAEKLEAAK